MEKLGHNASKEEAKQFIESMRGKTIMLHYENNINGGWGDDDIVEILLDENGISQSNKIVDEHFIHGAWEKV
jgi:hypothetical protein